MYPTGLPRRSFLHGLAAALTTAPALAQTAAAQSRPAARRLVIVFTPNGTSHRHWRPLDRPGPPAFAPGSILEPLAPHADELLVLDGIDFHNATNHEGGMSSMLTGGGGGSTATAGASVDQWIASQLGSQTRFASLELGVHTSAWGGNTQTRMSYRRAGEMVPPNDRPDSVYRRVFGGSGSAPIDRSVMMRRSVLDLVRDELRVLRRRVGSEERAKLDIHADAIRAMEGQLMSPGGQCSSAEPTLADVQHNDSFPAVGRAQTDLLVSALACDATRVATLQWSHTVSPTVFSWLGIGEGHHGLSHLRDESPRIGELVAAERWYTEQVAYLINRLDALPDPLGGGSMLDHTLVLWAKEMGDGRLHECRSVPFVIAGGAGGFFRTGRYLRFDHAPHQKLLVSVCRAMGLDNPTFGDPSFGTGELAGLRA